jgi:two-component system response regulator AtoC/two-component system nitrogen regulation response regulator NtrX
MKLLIVDDEETARYGVRRALDVKGRVYEAANLAAARRICREEQPELILLDLNLAGENGLDLLGEIQQQTPPPKVVVITAHGSERVAVEVMKRGAFDYLAKPFDIDELRLVVRNAAEQVALQEENRALKVELAAVRGSGDLIGTSRVMQRVYGLIDKVAETDVTVLLVGESGSGKELVARELHRRGLRARGPMITVNCAAIPENLMESELFGHEKGAFTGAAQRRIGKFEQARNGTLFLDEIGDMAVETQAKILRALEDRRIDRLGGVQPVEVDVRIISATNRDLREMVRRGEFREDLYYRLEVVLVDIPPLRERREDIPLLVDHFRRLFAERHRRPVPAVAPAAMARLIEFPYPGNVRQLRNLLERLVVLNVTGTIEEKELPEELRLYVPGQGVESSGGGMEAFLSMDFRDAQTAFETRYLLRKLRDHHNNITHTAHSIGILRQSLQQKIKELGLRDLLVDYGSEGRAAEE